MIRESVDIRTQALCIVLYISNPTPIINLDCVQPVSQPGSPLLYSCGNAFKVYTMQTASTDQSHSGTIQRHGRGEDGYN